MTGTVRSSTGSALVDGYVDAVDTTTHSTASGGYASIDGSGHYAMTLSAGSYELTAHPGRTNPDHDASASVLVDVSDPATSVSAPITLRAANVVGTIASPDGGTNLEGVTVNVVVPSDSTEQPQSAITDANGVFGLALAAGAYTLYAMPPATNPNHWLAAWEGVTVGAAGITSLPPIRLVQPNATGTVHTPDGTPVPDAQIDAYDAQGRQLSDGGFSDADGTFALHLSDAARSLRARSTPAFPQLTTGILTLPTTGAMTGLDLQLRTVNVAGAVLGLDHQPLGGAFVDVSPEPQSDPPVQLDAMTARADGGFGFHLDPGTYRLYAHPNPGTAGNPVTTSIVITLADTALTGRDIQLRAPNLTGRVTTPGGAAVPDALVRITDSSSIEQTVTTGADGGYGALVPIGLAQVVATPSSWNNPDLLSPGSWSGNVASTTAATVADVTLRRPNLTGTVYAPDGRTASYAGLSVFDVTSGRHVSVDVNQTNNVGRFGLTLPAGDYRITATPPYGAEYLPATVRRTIVDGGPPASADLRLVSRSARPYVLQPVSVNPAGAPGNGHSRGGVLAPAGDKAAFVSEATDVTTAAGPQGYQTDVYQRDLATQRTTLVSAAADGRRGNGSSDEPAISDSGAVVFRSYAGDLVAETNSVPDVFFRDAAGNLTRLSAELTDAAGAGADGADQPTISADGTTVAYVFHDVSEQVLELATRDALGWSTAPLARATRIYRPTLSADGSTLAYFAEDSGGMHLYVQHLGGPTQQVSPVAVGSGLRTAENSDLSLTANGAELVFTAYDDQDKGTPSVYDVGAGTVTPLRLFDYGDPSGLKAGRALISGDGAYVAVAAVAPDQADAGYAPEQTYVLERATGTLRLATIDAQGSLAYQPARPTAISGDGHALLVDSYDGVADNDSNGYQDVLLAQQHTDTTPPTWPAGSALRASGTGTTLTTLSWDEATDPSRVLAYRLLKNGVTVAEVPASSRSQLVRDLTPDTAYSFAVQAIDSFGNVTTDGPSLSVRTLASSTGTASALLSATAGPNASVALFWDAATGHFDSYRVYRATGDGAFAPVGDVSPSVTVLNDTGLDAQTTYRYKVVTVAGGVETPHTVTSSITTRTLRASAISGSVPKLADGVAKLGSAVSVTLSGEPGRTATATMSVLSWYDGSGRRLDATAQRDVTVPLTEDAGLPGTYRGTLSVEDGMARIVGLTGAVSDGAGHASTATAGGFPVDVSSALQVDITDPTRTFSSGRLFGYDYETGAGIDRTITGVGPSAVFPVAPATLDLRLALGAEQFPSAHASGVELMAGLVTRVPLTPTFPASLTLTVVGDAAALNGTSARVSQPGGPTSIGYLQSDGTISVDGLVSGADASVHLALPSGALFAALADLTLPIRPGTNTATLTAVPLSPATARGHVLRGSGGPAPGAAVTVVQTIGGRTFTFTASTDESGDFAVPALEGPAEVAVGFDGETQRQQAALPGDALQFAMTQKDAYVIDVNVYTRYPGASEQGPVTMDWRSAVHYGMTAVSPSSFVTGWNFGFDGGNGVKVLGRSGDVVDICASPEIQIALPGGCTTVTLGSDPRATLRAELHLGSQHSLIGSLLGGDGAPLQGSWTARAVQRGSDGKVIDLAGWRPELKMGLPQSGDYDLTVQSLSDSSQRASVHVVVGDGDVSLGTITLHGGRWFGGSAVAVPTGDVAPGSVADVRLQLTNAGSDVTAAVLRLPVPPHASIPVVGVTVGGRAADGTAVTNGVLSVPLPSLDTGQSAVVHVPVVPSSDAAALDLPINPSVAFTADGGEHTDFLSPATVTASGITLSAPVSTASRTLPLSGRAPAGATVQVSLLGAQLSQATASAGGFWRTTVTLPDQGPYASYLLLAKATVSGRELRSDPAQVYYRPGDPEVTQVSVYQIDSNRTDGRRFTFDPRKGMARFPFLFVPTQPLVVEATFSDPDRVQNVLTHVGDGNTGDATRGADGVFTARFDSPRGMGDIWFDFDLTPTPYDMTRTLPEMQRRANLPPDLVDASSSDVASPATGSATGQIHLPSQGNTTFPFEASVKDGTYTLTQADLDLAKGSGVPLLGLKVTEDDTGALVIHYAVPTAALGGTPVATAAVRRTGARVSASALRLRANVALPKLPFAWPKVDTTLSVKEQAIKVGKGWVDPKDVGSYKNWANLGVNGAQAADVDSKLPTNPGELNNYVGIGELYDKLSELMANCPDPTVYGPLKRRLDELNKQAQLMDNASRAMDVIGVLLAPETLGIGTVILDGTGAALGLFSNQFVGSQTHILEDEIGAAGANAKCDDWNRMTEFNNWARHHGARGHHAGPVGSANPIYDPSGYAYEGVRSNRVPGVTATLLDGGDSRTGPWQVWNAVDFGQVNPLVTDRVGHYGWDVPVGWWKVAFTKDGYLPAASEPVQVLPPHFDVDVAMVSTSPPDVSTVTADTGGVVLTFSQYMKTATVTGQQVTVTTSGGTPVSGTLTPVAPEPGVDGKPLARSYRFVPDAVFTAGSRLTVVVDAAVQSYAGKVLAQTWSRDVTVGAPAPSGGDGSGGGGQPVPPQQPTPSPTASPKPSPSPSIPCRIAPLITLPSGGGIAGRPVPVSVHGRPGQRVGLFGYVRPSTHYVRLRSGTVPASGVLRFQLAPRGNARLYATADGCPSSRSVVLAVHPAVSLQITHLRGRVYRISGSVSPPRGYGVTLLQQTSYGEVVVASASTDRSGRFQLTRVLSGPGRVRLVVTTSGGALLSTGRSPVRTIDVG